MSVEPTTLADAPAVPERLTVSLKTLAKLLDAHRSSIRRWLSQDGIRPISLGRGRNAAIRYRWSDIQSWLRSRDYVS
ncbi:MAG: helix-turn-helix transcriptional regulator [Phycisphaerae bacterium]